MPRCLGANRRKTTPREPGCVNHRATQLAKKATNRAKPRDVTLPVFSNPFTLKITAAPITLAIKNTPGTFAAGSVSGIVSFLSSRL